MAKLECPENARWLMGHVRYYTHGAPEYSANNHPIIHRNMIGIHNGVIRNYDSILKTTGREDDKAQVDSEAIFAAIQHYGIRKGLDKIRGDAAVAFVDDRRPQSMYLGRLSGRPLVYARTAAGSFIFASEAKVLDAGGFTLAGRTYTTASQHRIMRVTGGIVEKRIRLTPTTSGYSATGSVGKPYSWQSGGFRPSTDSTGTWQPRTYYDGDLGIERPSAGYSGQLALPSGAPTKGQGGVRPSRSKAPRLSREDLEARSPVKFDHDLTPEEVCADLNSRPMLRRAIKDLANGSPVEDFFVWDGKLVTEWEYIDLAQRQMDLEAAFAAGRDA